MSVEPAAVVWDAGVAVGLPGLTAVGTACPGTGGLRKLLAEDCGETGGGFGTAAGSLAAGGGAAT